MEPVCVSQSGHLSSLVETGPESPHQLLSLLWSRLKESMIIPDPSPSQRPRPEEVQSRDE